MSTRADRLEAAVAGRELDALIVSDAVNVRYLTGFTGTNGACLVGPGIRQFLTDFRYVEQASAQVDGFDLVRGRNDLLADAAGLVQAGARVGFEDQHLAVRRFRSLEEAVPDGVELVAAGGAVEDLRAVKDESELRAIGAAAELADSIYEYLCDRGLAGRNEREVAVDLEREMRARGADDPSFASIIASGPHGALPHAEPRDVAIERDTLVVTDLGCRLDGYCSDCTRTLATGEVGAEARAIYDLVLRAQEAALGAVWPGASARDVDAVARDMIAEAGHGENFGHGLGHGVGLEVHEAPRLSQQANGELAAGNVVTVEPGVYLAGAFGVRIEDLVVVTDDGPEILSRFPKSLTVAGA